MKQCNEIMHRESMFHSQLPILSRLGNSGLKPPIETGLIGIYAGYDTLVP
jgi:hypothetical protein